MGRQPARVGPLNRDRPFSAWPPFDPGAYLDMNPSVVETASRGRWVVFCRYPVPPQPGQGSIWAVAVDAALIPVGRPMRLIGQGIDPRVVALGDRLLIFYALLERDDREVIDGSSVVLAEFAVAGEAWQCSSAYTLPKLPISGQRSADATDKWEKNWVPFPIGDEAVGLIYAHEPWDVIVMRTSAGQAPSLEQHHRSPGLVWDYGTIRGGTPPVRYDDHHLITVFHAAQVIGSRRVYTAGACVFTAAPPYTPRLQTREPLLMAPYGRGAARFGWGFAGSVVFPAGAVWRDQGLTVVNGIDDGEIATFPVRWSDLAARLEPVAPPASGTLRNSRDGTGLRLPATGLVYWPDEVVDPGDQPVVAFARAVMPRGRTLVDVGAHIGDFTMPLAPRFDRVIAFEGDASLVAWLERNRAFNGYRHVACHSTMPHAGPSARLDGHGFTDVDLLKIDAPGSEAALLRGAEATIRASKPLVLLKMSDEPGLRQSVATLLAGLDYGFEPIFPRTPAWVLARPAEGRPDVAWFLE